MARWMQTYVPGSCTDRWVLNIDKAVGSGCANLRSDVIVVQFFLEALRQKKVWGSSDELVRDGICGPRTNSAILSFQQNIWNDRQPNLVTDGKVGPLRAGAEWPMTTLGWMQELYLENHQTWPNIFDHPLFPSYTVLSDIFF